MLKMQIDGTFVNIAALIILFICAIIDIRKKEIPLIILLTVSLAVLGIDIWKIFLGHVLLLDMAVSVLPGIFFLLLGFCTGEKIGYGDGFLIIFLGLSFGFGRCLLSVFIGLLASSIFALFLLVFCKADRNSRLPLAPFLSIGMGVSFFV
ncbi:MAG: prepilin peptidase [Butyrivibrio sp.]|nr:prepilin peptidase [Butyrivibrio sp.]